MRRGRLGLGHPPGDGRLELRQLLEGRTALRGLRALGGRRASARRARPVAARRPAPRRGSAQRRSPSRRPPSRCARPAPSLRGPQVEAALARDAPGERGGLDTPVGVRWGGCRRGRRGRRRRDAARRRPRRRRSASRSTPSALSASRRRHRPWLLTRLADPRDHLPDRQGLALLRRRSRSASRRRRPRRPCSPCRSRSRPAPRRSSTSSPGDFSQLQDRALLHRVGQTRHDDSVAIRAPSSVPTPR